MTTPTSEQIRIIDEIESCVVIAQPGSGKTYTVAEKIRRILPNFPHYQGVIAISFTNKASNELQNRVLAGGFDPKSSFFGTIDKFFLTELIYPFGRHLFGRPSSEPQVTSFAELTTDEKGLVTSAQVESTIFDSSMADWYGGLFSRGKAVLECNGGAAYWILKNSSAARRYLTARYCWIFIDEYQDCDYWQDRFFVALSKAIRAVAVGDLNQSIFGFARKHSRYLRALTANKRFRHHMLTVNHRSHVSITNYAARLLWADFKPESNDIHRVHFRLVVGDEINIGRWIGDVLTTITEHYAVSSPNQIGILAKSKQTIDLVSKGLAVRGISHRIREDTSLDRDTSLWASLFRALLSWTLSADPSKYEVIDRYLDIAANRSAAKRLSSKLKELEAIVHQPSIGMEVKRDRFIAIARSLMPSAENRGTIGSLVGVLSNQNALASYAPISSHEIHLMTLHKSKGLEFDVVFHLDLYESILPQYNGDIEQCLNLHYVGITRAKKACFLVSSTQRHRRQDGSVIDAIPSPFLSRHGLELLRDIKQVAPAPREIT